MNLILTKIINCASFPPTKPPRLLEQKILSKINIFLSITLPSEFQYCENTGSKIIGVGTVGANLT